MKSTEFALPHAAAQSGRDHLRPRLAACLLALLVAACGGRTPTPAPSVARASIPLSHPSAPSSAPSSTTISSSGPTPVATSVPPITFASGSVQTLPSGTFALAAGKAYTLTAPAEPYPPVTLAEVPLASGARRTLVTRPAGHVLSSLVLDGAHLLWVESWYAHPQPANGETGGNPNAGQPLLWQIVSSSISTGVQSVLASGESTNIPLIGEAAAPQPPLLTADGDRVAYAMDAGGNGMAAGMIVAYSLSTGERLRFLRTNGYVTQLGLAGQALFYRQTTDGFGSDSSLMLACSDTETPFQIDTHVSDAAMDGQWLVWSRSDATDASIWTASLALGMSGPPVPVRVYGPSLPIGQSGPTGNVAVGNGVVAWIVWFSDVTHATNSVLVIWTPGEIEGRVIAGQRQPDWVAVQDGMLVWHESLPLPGHPDTHAVPLAAIPAMP